LFDFNAMPNLKALGADLPATAWQPLTRLPGYTVQTQPRQRPDNVKEAMVVEREFDNQRLYAESVAEFCYRPTACGRSFRMRTQKNERQQTLARGTFACLRTRSSVRPANGVFVGDGGRSRKASVGGRGSQEAESVAGRCRRLALPIAGKSLASGAWERENSFPRRSAAQ
jgi:hypothetical protein